jgi:membrane fusion protein, heavy metal efflux system
MALGRSPKELHMLHRLKENNAARLAAALFMALGLAACSHGAGDGAQPAPIVVADNGVLRVPEKSPLRSELVIKPVEMRQLPHVVTFPATVEADPSRTANVLPPLTGKVIALKVGLGDHVVRGQLLAVIASGDLAQASTDVDKARDALDLARKTLDRARSVQAAGGSARKDLEAAQSAQNQAQAEFDRAQTRLTAVGGAAGEQGPVRTLQVTAPVTGYITALSVAPGTYVNDATAAMMTVSNLDAVWITANVPESDVGFVAKGQNVNATLSAYPNDTFHGTVSFVSPVLQSDTRRDMVRIAFDNADGRLKPNMFANTRFDIAQPAQVFVPDSALLMNNDNISVFVEVAPWTFQRRTVELSYDETAGARVVKGLKEGDRVIVSGGVLLND